LSRRVISFVRSQSEKPLGYSVISTDGNILLDALSENGVEPVSFDYAIGASMNVRECCTSLERGENERRTRASVWTRMWCSVVIINPQWLTRLRTSAWVS